MDTWNTCYKKGLLIDPCIPNDWKEFSVKRLFRGTIYNIKVFRKSSKYSNVYMQINGKRTETNLIPASKKQSIDVEVFI